MHSICTDMHGPAWIQVGLRTHRLNCYATRRYDNCSKANPRTGQCGVVTPEAARESGQSTIFVGTAAAAAAGVPVLRTLSEDGFVCASSWEQQRVPLTHRPSPRGATTARANREQPPQLLLPLNTTGFFTFAISGGVNASGLAMRRGTIYAVQSFLYALGFRYWTPRAAAIPPTGTTLYVPGCNALVRAGTWSMRHRLAFTRNVAFVSCCT